MSNGTLIEGVKEKSLRRGSETSSSASTSRRSSRPESVAQRILRERQEQNLKTRFLVDQVPPSKTSGTSFTSTTGSKPQILPLHLALRQSASKNHRTFMDERNRPPSQNGSS